MTSNLINTCNNRRTRKSWVIDILSNNGVLLPSRLRKIKDLKSKSTTKLLSKLPMFPTLTSFVLLLTTLVFIGYLSMYDYHYDDDLTNIDIDYSHSRTLLSSECFPKRARPAGLVVFPLLGCFYMFIALSIIVDEFFVPALETISLKLDISNDVAGATLMAAGGSAPELFTSFIGTFQRTDVGFAAIVGSAVFNVLFVIACCALSSPYPLKLTWWPLARDCTYYAFGLGILSIFFSVTTPSKIDWWEALILFILYLGYVLFMKFNEQAYEKLTGHKLALLTMNEEEKCKQNQHLSHQNTTQDVENNAQQQNDSNNDDIDHQKTDNGIELAPPNNNENTTKNPELNRCLTKTSIKCKEVKYDINTRETTFRAGFLNILLKDEWSWSDVVSVQAVNSIVGDVEQTFKNLDKDGSGYIEAGELATLLDNLHADLRNTTLAVLVTQLDTDGDGKVSFEEFSKWYLKSEQRVLGRMKEFFGLFDFDQSATLDRKEIKALIIATSNNSQVDHTVNLMEIDKSVNQAFEDAGLSDENAQMTFDQFRQWYVRTKYYDTAMLTADKIGNEAEGVENLLEFPKSIRGRFWFILTIPLLFLFMYTIPDVRKPGKQKWCIIAFIISILWIGVSSWFMVEWTTIVGDTFRIPLVVMGLTFLAAGTSVPDLLSSIVVAKQGHGDMAVSSSIGSNIFDILVGLPLPWLSFSIIFGQQVSVGADNLAVSILILLGMILYVVIAIHISKWKMTKLLGGSMFVMYFIFVAQDLARTQWGC